MALGQISNSQYSITHKQFVDEAVNYTWFVQNVPKNVICYLMLIQANHKYQNS